MRVYILVCMLALVCGSAEARNRRGSAVRPREMRVSATAYCLRGKTSTGDHVRKGVVAADPRVLPVGTVFRISGGGKSTRGTYRVADRGAAVKGHEIDIFMPSCREAERFGRRRVRLEILKPASAIARR